MIGEIQDKKKGSFGFLWVENQSKDAEAEYSNEDGNDLRKVSIWGIDDGFDDHAACREMPHTKASKRRCVNFPSLC